MSVDTQRLMDLSPMFHTAVVIAVALYFLHNTLGPSIFAGLAVMILMIPINGFVAGKVRSLQMQQMVLKDNRVKLMSELLAGMKVNNSKVLTLFDNIFLGIKIIWLGTLISRPDC